ncbi:hypothetical protein KP509_19G040900 [Ceratopteris richardii]|uniref:Uncharacterized protein n=1 Tax=Ceratopteris richardii TaxID=49495 RepID=A0A8T2SKI0_CERRI|nr:hypothetical protein KP509_19G040900 [Ceratopteris richardii]
MGVEPIVKEGGGAHSFFFFIFFLERSLAGKRGGDLVLHGSSRSYDCGIEGREGEQEGEMDDGWCADPRRIQEYEEARLRVNARVSSSNAKEKGRTCT